MKNTICLLNDSFLQGRSFKGYLFISFLLKWEWLYPIRNDFVGLYDSSLKFAKFISWITNIAEVLVLVIVRIDI